MGRPLGSKNKSKGDIRPEISQPEDVSIRYIALNRGYIAIVDSEEYESLNSRTWYVRTGKHNNYAYAHVVKDKKISMHAEILGGNRFKDGIHIDHINRNSLDNRKSNLRLVPNYINNFNSRIPDSNTSGVKGVSWYKRVKTWQVYITYKSKRIPLGNYKEFEKAVAVRRDAEIKYFGFNPQGELN